MDAAYRVFAREGYYGATLEAIASEAGVSKGALYYNFESKQELFYALLGERLAARAADIRADGALESPPATTPENWAAHAVDSLPVDREWNLLFLEFACAAARQPETGRRLATQLLSFRSGGAEEMRRLIEYAGVESAVPYERLARIMAAIANGLALDLILGVGKEPETDARETLATAMALLWRGTVSVSNERRGGAGDVR